MRTRIVVSGFLLALLVGCGGDGSSSSDSQSSNSAPSGTVSIAGATAEYETLIASNNLSDPDGMGNVSYQWMKDGAEIAGASTSSYVLSYSDIGSVITVIASYTDDAGNDESIESDPTAAISPVNEFMSFFSDDNVYVNTSRDSGASWDGVMPFSVSGADAPYGYDGAATSDGKGNIIAVWGAEEISGFGTEIDLAYKVSSDNGATWSALATLNSEAATDSGDDEYPKILTTGNGRWIVVWLADVGGSDNILYSISDDKGATWTPQASIYSTTDTVFNGQPCMANDGGNNWVVAWSSTYDTGSIGTDTDILYTYSRDNGDTWSIRAALDSRASSDSAAETTCTLVMDATGNAIAAWLSTNDLGGTIATDLDVFVSTSSDFGQTWSTSAVANDDAATDGRFDREPILAMDDSGNALLVWSGLRSGSAYDLFVTSTSDYGATWSSVGTVNNAAFTDPTDDRAPTIATDKEGNWLVVWRDLSQSNSTISSSVSTDYGQSWSDKVNVDEGAMGESAFYNFLTVY
ncbi:sialidase family protein [Marinobacter sp. chi1]|uniref:Sialidase family protein n=1 Tax=Marinobacter suaedae TaxID=3057675 RepID=A0ABT8VXR6_9GAMM|nr:sialidase family protein [Marinobacter sp. chi1]MDO3720735.1 sialidase family protein [Marinobacter sp. chi1]